MPLQTYFLTIRRYYMCFYELFCYLNIFFPFCKSETSKKFWFLPWRIVTMPKSFLGWWFLFFFSLRNIHNTKQQLVTLQPQRPILMFSSAIQHSNFKNLWNIIIIIYLKNNIHPSVYYYREELISTEGLRFHYLATFGKVSCWGSL